MKDKMAREMTEYFLKISLCYLSTKKSQMKLYGMLRNNSGLTQLFSTISYILFFFIFYKTLPASMTEQEPHIWQVNSNG